MKTLDDYRERAERLGSDYFDEIKSRTNQQNGWTAYEDFKGVAARAYYEDGRITQISIKAWSEVN